MVSICLILILGSMYRFIRYKGERSNMIVIILGLLILTWFSYSFVGGMICCGNAYSENNINKFRVDEIETHIKSDDIVRELSKEDYEYMKRLEQDGGKPIFKKYYFEGKYSEKTFITWPFDVSYTFSSKRKFWEIK